MGRQKSEFRNVFGAKWPASNLGKSTSPATVFLGVYSAGELRKKKKSFWFWQGAGRDWFLKWENGFTTDAG